MLGNPTLQRSDPLVASGVFSLNQMKTLKQQNKWPPTRGVIGFGLNASGMLTPRANASSKAEASIVGYVTTYESYTIWDGPVRDFSAGHYSLTTVYTGILIDDTTGRLYTWGSNNGLGRVAATVTTQQTPDVVNSDTWLRCSTSGAACVAIRTDGTLWSWGIGTNYRSGQPATTALTVPTQIGTANNWVRIAQTQDVGFAINSLGELYSWGTNANGVTGKGVSSGSATIERVGTDSDWAEVYTNYQTSWAVKTDGSLYACGSNSAAGFAYTTGTTLNFTRVGTDLNWTSVVIAHQPGSALRAAAFVKSDGTLWCTGSMAGLNVGVSGNYTATLPQQVGTDTDWYHVYAVNEGFYATKKQGGLYYFSNTSTKNSFLLKAGGTTGIPLFIANTPAGTKVAAATNTGTMVNAGIYVYY